MPGSLNKPEISGKSNILDEMYQTVSANFRSPVAAGFPASAIHPDEPPGSGEDPHPFGEPFSLTAVRLPRPACAYAVQYLGTDQVLDRQTLRFLSIRTAGLDAAFPCFATAETAARQWLAAQTAAEGERLARQHPVSIVPLGLDVLMQRPVLIWGMIPPDPLRELEMMRAAVQAAVQATAADAGQSRSCRQPRSSPRPATVQKSLAG